MTASDFNNIMSMVELEVTSLELLNAALDGFVPVTWTEETSLEELRKLMTEYHENLTFMLDELVLLSEAQRDQDGDGEEYHLHVFSAYNALVYDNRKNWHQKYLDFVRSM